MNFAQVKKKLIAGCISAFVLSLAGCATGDAVKKEKQARYVGYSNIVTLNGKHQFGGSSLVEYERFKNTASQLQVANGIKSQMQFVGPTNILYTIAYADGSFETKFGTQVDLIFSYQQCNSVAYVDVFYMKCMDSNPAPLTSARKTVMLKGGESTKIEFPSGVQWNYRVFDQGDINMPE
ncbi:hypothetical protein [Undibacterium sp. TC9W]|uniref:hypothetical protein n=1 Tax=Undibacterium sp. TC9W TaxID=3413053 RepID=UPI003BF0B7DA